MIEAVINDIDAEVANVTETTYAALAGDVGQMVLILGTLGFLILCFNMLVQVVPMHGGAFIVWAVRLILINAAATSWAFFQPVYAALNSIPDGIAGLLLGGESLAGGLQNTADVLTDGASSMMSEASWRDIDIHLVALLIWVIGVLLTCAAILVIGISKLGLGIALGLAPVFIVTLLFKATSDLFGAWTKFTLSFMMNLILTAGIIGVIVTIIEGYTNEADATDGLSGMVPTIVIAVAAVFFLRMVPGYASALAGSLAVGGLSLAQAATGTASAAGSALSAGRGAANLPGNIRDTHQKWTEKAASRYAPSPPGTFTKGRHAGHGVDPLKNKKR